MKLTPIILGLAMASTFIACKKDSDSTTTTTDRATLLKAGGKSWKISAGTISPAIDLGSGPTTNFLDLMEACSKDDLVKFADSGVYTEDEGATKCDPADPQTTTGTWALIESNAKLRTTTASGSDTITIVSISATELKGSMTQDLGGTVYTITQTMKPN